jgi:hypothetical protein
MQWGQSYKIHAGFVTSEEYRKSLNELYTELEEPAGCEDPSGQTEGREVGPGSHRLVSGAETTRGDALRASKSATSKVPHSPRTAIGLDSDKRLDRSSLGFWPPHQSVQANARQHVNYRTDPIPEPDPPDRVHRGSVRRQPIITSSGRSCRGLGAGRSSEACGSCAPLAALGLLQSCA